MKRLTRNQQKIFMNPIENLEDLFRYIAREIRANDIRSGDGRCTARKGSLTIELGVTRKGVDIHETLTISKPWARQGCETIIYSSCYEMKQAYIAKKVLALKDAANHDTAILQAVNADQEKTGRPVFMNMSAFAMRVEYVQLPETSLIYEADSISRALQTLISLGLDSSANAGNDSGKKRWHGIVRRLLFDEDVEYELRQTFGGFLNKPQKAAIRQGLLKCEKPVSETFLDTDPPWCMGYILCDLCRYYCG
jgi:hypothetical protein